METHRTIAAGRTSFELLEDDGNCRPSIHQVLNFHSLNDSVFSEQQKLRLVLDWAHSFLNSGSDNHQETCRADNLTLAGKKQKETERTSFEQSFSAKQNLSESCTTYSSEFPERRSTLMKDWELDPLGAFPQNNGSTDMIFERAESFGKLDEKIKESEKQVEMMKVWENIEDCPYKENGLKRFKGVKNTVTSHNQPQKILKHVSETSNSKTTCQFKVPSGLTVYEQYQLYVDKLNHLRLKHHQDKEPASSTESPEEERKTSEEPAAPHKEPDLTSYCFKSKSPKIKSELMEWQSKVKTKRGPTAEITEKKTENQSVAKRHFSEKNNVTNTGHLDLYSNKHDGFMKRMEAVTPNDNVVKDPESLRAAPGNQDEIAALTTDPVTENAKHHQGVKGHEVGDKGQKKRSGGQDQQGLFETSMSKSPTFPRQQLRPQKQTHASENTTKHVSQFRDAHTRLTNTPSTKAITLPTDDPRPASPAWGMMRNANTNTTDCKFSSTGVPLLDWLCLPDEVWLSILSLLPQRDLSTAVQVCSRLQTLATDYTLWKHVRIENSTLTERWLLSVGKRHPRSLCLYSCSGLSISSCGLEKFFTLCRNTLEEISVTSCAGLGLHGDQLLPLVSQLCDRVTSIDVSWSGTTEKGVRALSYTHEGIRLKSIALNGCHVTDDPLMNLVMKHRKSLCRLEVFGCQFLTASCLQTVYQMCPGLQHLNIGQVPKVNTHSLRVMTSQLKCLVSLNLTGLKAVTDATLETLLQNCVDLQSLTLSFCPGITDLTLQNISKYTPFIRSLDVNGCKTITDLGVQSLTVGCRRLQQLDLSSTGTGNRGVALLANYCSMHLHTVKLSFCHISLENILKLCRCCKRLNILHLYGCVQLPNQREVRDANTTVKVYPRP